MSVHEIGNQFSVFQRVLDRLENAVEGFPVNNALSACLVLAVRLAQEESGLDRLEALTYLKEEIGGAAHLADPTRKRRFLKLSISPGL